MRVSKKILIEENDVSGLHSELTDIVNFFIDNSVGGKGEDNWVRKEFPNIVKLRRLLDAVVIEEPGTLIYDRLHSLIRQQETSTVGSKLSGYLRMVPPQD